MNSPFLTRRVSTKPGQLQALEAENRRLKQLLADAMLDNQALKGLLAKNW